MYEEEQRKAGQRMAAHKAHATRKVKRFVELKKEIDACTKAGREVSGIAEMEAKSALLFEQIGEHDKKARQEDYCRRGYRAAATRQMRQTS